LILLIPAMPFAHRLNRTRREYRKQLDRNERGKAHS
jgi:hypothetical protein